MKPSNCTPCVPGIQSLFLYFVILACVYLLANYTFRDEGTPVKQLSSMQFQDLDQKKGKNVQPLDLKSLSHPAEEMLQKAKTIYSAQCSMCHGEEGKGDGVASQGMAYPPRDFHSADGWAKGRKLSDIFITLTEGIAARGMPGFDTLPAQDRFALSHLVRSFRNDNPKTTEQEMAELAKKYGLDQVSNEPNQIPVQRAMQILAGESSSQSKSAFRFLDSLERDAEIGRKGAKLILESFQKPALLFTLLSKSPRWKRSPGAFQTYLLMNSRSLHINSHGKILSLDQASILYQYLREHPAWDPSAQVRDELPESLQQFQGATLLSQFDCTVCHDSTAYKIGPSYKMIRDKYQNTEENLIRLVEKVRMGGSGSFGDIPMVPHMHIGNKEVRAMVSSILNPEASSSDFTAASSARPLEEKLLQSNGCMVCHNPTQKLVGPSLQSIAKKYEMNQGNISSLMEKVRKGGAGNWGQVPMISHSDIDSSELKTMVKYILSLNGGGSSPTMSTYSKSTHDPTKSKGCLVCHNPTQKLVGPSYKSISEKYENNQNNITALMKKIKKGGAGNWGNVPMIPHSDLSSSELKNLAEYILSYGKAPQKSPQASSSGTGNDPMKLASKNLCMSCHNPTTKVVGPSFQMLAKKYDSDETTLKKLIQKVQKGGGGVWGSIPMTPNSHVPEDELRTIITHMLNFK